ncbi:hypothetical protein H6G80_14215 [Nostoc sp. FACHB-87]|uniref:hypothetical protein n=1 Tax=Nostocaceae TaxID=1162 RepID=UPI0016868BAB|nr:MULTISPECIES: hypothetical protein [Nostocaceae]MBD2300751.1 hypothetical protein [Nostoc sp. FACHB-190]MBD2455231.1 hypothetical protein [Nostoc sp. FACHB-87]MBD2476944.1 hypothetical protein [Anabaena sp. FACHB-83]
MNYQICDLEATPEWLKMESIDYIAECLETCETLEMVADLREIFPRQTLRSASIKVCEAQRQRLINWLQVLNQQDQVA